MSDRRRGLTLFGAVPAVALVALFAVVGAIAMYAESQRDWGSYFLMEQAMTTGADVAMPLLVLAILGGFGLVAIAPRFER